MIGLLFRIIMCGLSGILCGYGGCRWAEALLAKRGRSYSLEPKIERLVCIGAFVPGAAAGYVTTGLINPVYCLILLFIGVTVGVTDWTHRIIPNPTVLAVFALKLVFGIPALFGWKAFPEFKPLFSLIGMIICFALFMAPGFLGKNVGAGDVKLAAAMGFILGPMHAMIAVVIMGVVVLLYSKVQRRMPILQFLREQIPMGPFIAAGMYVSFLLMYNLS